jgi:hypothetical protein
LQCQYDNNDLLNGPITKAGQYICGSCGIVVNIIEEGGAAAIKKTQEKTGPRLPPADSQTR